MQLKRNVIDRAKELFAKALHHPWMIIASIFHTHTFIHSLDRYDLGRKIGKVFSRSLYRRHCRCDLVHFLATVRGIPHTERYGRMDGSYKAIYTNNQNHELIISSATELSTYTNSNAKEIGKVLVGVCLWVCVF